jgi:hypothetical protein
VKENIFKEFLPIIRNIEGSVILQTKNHDKNDFNNDFLIIIPQKDYAAANLAISRLLKDLVSEEKGLKIRYADHPIIEDNINNIGEFGIYVLSDFCWFNSNVFLDKRWESTTVKYSSNSSFILNSLIDLKHLRSEKNLYFSKVRDRNLLQRLPYVRPSDNQGDFLVNYLVDMGLIRNEEKDFHSSYKDAMKKWNEDYETFIDNTRAEDSKRKFRVIDWI